jgi:hypothetical protein
MKHSDTIADLAKALASFHGEAHNPKSDKTAEIKSERTGKTFTYGYPDFAAMLEEYRPQLAGHGLSVLQELVITPGVVGAATTILHESGQWLELAPAFVPSGEEAKDYGAAASYSRRYAYMACLGLAADDGDAPPAPRQKGSAGPGASSEAQQKKIGFEVKAGGMEGELAAVLAKRYKVDSVKALTKAQASDLIERLLAEKERRASAAAAGADPVTGEVAAETPEDGTDYWPSDDDVPGMDAAAYKAQTAAAAEKPKEGLL